MKHFPGFITYSTAHLLIFKAQDLSNEEDHNF